MPRHIYIVVNDTTGERRAHPLLRGAKLHAVDVPHGRILRATVTDAMTGRDLYAALFNGDGLDDIVEAAIVRNGRLHQPQSSEDGSGDGSG